MLIRVTLAVADPWFPQGGTSLLFCQILAENCMKMKEFGQRGGVPGTPLYSPMLSGCFWFFVSKFWEALVHRSRDTITSLADASEQEPPL